MFNRYSPQDQRISEKLDKEPLPKINAVFEEESKEEYSSHKSDKYSEEDKKDMESSSDHSIEDPRDHDANYGAQPEEGEQNFK